MVCFVLGLSAAVMCNFTDTNITLISFVSNLFVRTIEYTLIIILVLMVAEFHRQVWKSFIKLLTRTDFIDYHPPDPEARAAGTGWFRSPREEYYEEWSYR
jgi:hypothetical protein